MTNPSKTRRNSSPIANSKYAPAQPPQDDRRQRFESLAHDPTEIARAKREIAQMSRQQGGRPSSQIQLDDVEVQQRKPLHLVAAPDPAQPPAAPSAPQQFVEIQEPIEAPAIISQPPAISDRPNPSAPALELKQQVLPATPASRAMFHHVEHRPVHSAPTRSAPAPQVAYRRDEQYVSHDMYQYLEEPMALLRGSPLLLMFLAILIFIPIIWMLLQPSRTFISPYSHEGSGNPFSDAINKVLGNTTVFLPPSIDVPAGDHSILGKPSITEDQIEAVLAQYNSPARGTGKIWLVLGQQYGIDPAYPLAFFVQESTAGANRGWAGLKSDGGTTHNVGNIICAGYATCYKGNRDYPSWEAGIDDWYRLIAREYVEGRGLASVEQILPIYCPISDGCRSYDYIAIVNSMVQKWRQGQLFQ